VYQQNGTLNESWAMTSPIFDKEILSKYIPRKGSSIGQELESCKRYIDPLPFDVDGSNGTLSMSTVSCDGQFVYDTSIYQQSRVYEVSFR